MDQVKCFTKTRCSQPNQELSLKSASIKGTFDKVREKGKAKWFGLMEAYLKVSGIMMKDSKAEW